MSTTNNLVNIPTQTQTGPNKKLNKCIKFYKEDVAPSSSNEDADSEINLNKAVDRDEPYGKVVQQETKECIDKKRNHMLQDDYYSSTIHQEKIINMAKLPEYITLTENELNARIEEIFEELLKLPNSFVNTIVENLNNYKLSDMFGSVGPMCSCKSLNFLMNANTNAIEKSFEELEKDIAATRFILNDGDSFYRSFMFALIEHQILSQNLLDFKKLIYGVATKTRSLIFKRKNTEINMNEVLYILYLIYMDISKGNIINAYGIFITAVNQSRSFDYGLIKYMKVALSEYITTNADLIFKNEHFEEIEKIAAPAYLNNHSFNYKEYIENRILTMHYDADKFIVQLSPAVFNVNLDLYAVEGTAQQAQHITYLKNYFHCLSDQNTRFSIALFYHFSRYDKLYSKEFLRLYEDKITYIKRDYHQEKRFTIVNANITCENCKVQSDEISFVHIPNYTFCKNCVIEALDKVITKRIAYITNENYNNTGYYCRPVSLGKTFEFTLSDEDVKDPIKKELINPKFNASPRELMQWLGTDIMREEFNKKFNYSGSIWIDSVKDKVKTLLDNNKDVVIDDVRFQNEVDMIHSLGGIVINLRNDLDNTLNNSTSTHSSENQKLTFNYEFVNDKSYSNTYDIYLNLDLLFNKHYGLL